MPLSPGGPAPHVLVEHLAWCTLKSPRISSRMRPLGLRLYRKASVPVVMQDAVGRDGTRHPQARARASSPQSPQWGLVWKHR